MPRELKNRAGQVFSRPLRSLLNLATAPLLIWRSTRPAGVRSAPTFRCRTPRPRLRNLRRSATDCRCKKRAYASSLSPLARNFDREPNQGLKDIRGGFRHLAENALKHPSTPRFW
jgi:hypothetical protein